MLKLNNLINKDNSTNGTTKIIDYKKKNEELLDRVDEILNIFSTFNIQQNNNNNIKNNNNNNTIMSKTGILFYKIIHNKFLFKKILSFFPIYLFEFNSIVLEGIVRWDYSSPMNKNSILITGCGGCYTKNAISLINNGYNSFVISFDLQLFNSGGISISFSSNRSTINTSTHGLVSIEFNKNEISIKTKKDSILVKYDDAVSLKNLNNGLVNRVNVLYNQYQCSLSVVLNFKLIIDNIKIPSFKNDDHDQLKQTFINLAGTLNCNQKIISNIQILKQQKQYQ